MLCLTDVSSVALLVISPDNAGFSSHNNIDMSGYGHWSGIEVKNGIMHNFIMFEVIILIFCELYDINV